MAATAGCRLKSFVSNGEKPAMGDANVQRQKGPKTVAIVGPFSGGKSTLLEAILARTGAINRQSPASSGNMVGNSSPEAKAHGMSVEATLATTEFMGENLTFIDCPGSIEFAFEADPVLSACDIAVVVAEADDKKVPALQLIMKRLENHNVPVVLFLNKIDKAEVGIRDTLKLLQPVSEKPLMLRQIPLRSNGAITGSIDLALERAYIYQPHAESEVAEIPDEDKAREVEARFAMLETLADHDDALMEQLLEDVEPPKDEIFSDLTTDLRNGSIIPVLIGAAETGNGVLRLLKTLRHDAPGIEQTRKRIGLSGGNGTVAKVIKTIHTPHGGKLSVVRVLDGTLSDGDELHDADGKTMRVSGLYRLVGMDQTKLAKAGPGETVALGKLEEARTGDVLTSAKGGGLETGTIEPPQPVFSIAIRPKERKDEVRLSTALHRICEEDPSLTVVQHQDTGETVLQGHGEMHLRVAAERLAGKYQIAIESREPDIPYRETITKSVSKRGRHKKQSGGHGQFGDVVIDIKPLPRSSGFEFTNTITGGVVPRQYIPSVETGVRDYLKSGPLGLPVVDLAVNLSDGSHHSVDSSDMAFQMAGKLAMREGMAECGPVLLEPVMKVEIQTPSGATAKITALIPQRRGQILGFDARPGWPGWDVVEAMIPLADMRDLIVELRSASAGVASYVAEFDHMAELTGRRSDEIVEELRKAG